MKLKFAQQASVLIVSAVRLLNDGLVEALGRDDGLSVSRYCSNLEEALAKDPKLSPYDVELPPQVRIVVPALAETTESAIAWVEVGVAGYIPKTAGLADVAPILVGSIRASKSASVLWLFTHAKT